MLEPIHNEQGWVPCIRHLRPRRHCRPRRRSRPHHRNHHRHRNRRQRLRWVVVLDL